MGRLKLQHFCPEELEDLKDCVQNWANGFRLSDYDIEVGLGETKDENKEVYAETSFSDHWRVKISFFPKFFESDKRMQLGTILHELCHIIHKDVDTLCEAAFNDNDQMRAVYDEAQEKNIEHLERAFLFMADIVLSK